MLTAGLQQKTDSGGCSCEDGEGEAVAPGHQMVTPMAVTKGVQQEKEMGGGWRKARRGGQVEGEGAKGEGESCVSPTPRLAS